MNTKYSKRSEKKINISLPGVPSMRVFLIYDQAVYASDLNLNLSRRQSAVVISPCTQYEELHSEILSGQIGVEEHNGPADEVAAPLKLLPLPEGTKCKERKY